MFKELYENFKYLKKAQDIEIEKIDENPDFSIPRSRKTQSEYEHAIQNIVDDEETWLIDNCTPLFFIEKSADIVQNIVRKSGALEKILKNVLKYYTDRGVNVEELGNNALRIINLNTKDVPYQDPSKHPKIIKQIIEKIMGRINYPNEQKIDISKNHEFILALSLSFDVGGGHFSLVFFKHTGTEWIVGIIDPYTNYYRKAFKDIIESIVKELCVRLNINYKLTYMELTEYDTSRKYKGIQNITFNDSRAPKNRKEVSEIQSENNQDHFCFMWCVYFFEKFLVYRWVDNQDFKRALNSIKGDYVSMSDNTYNTKLTFIKKYINVNLYQRNLINIEGGITRNFFEEYFPYIWGKKGMNFKLCDLDNNEITDPNVLSVFNPIIAINGVDYELKNSEKRRIFDSLNPNFAINNDIQYKLSNIVSLFYFKLDEYFQIQNISKFTSPTDVYNDYFDISNNIDVTKIDTANKLEVDKAFDRLFLKEFTCNFAEYKANKNKCPPTTRFIRSPGNLLSFINNRNQIKSNIRFDCAVNSQTMADVLLKLEPYQEAVLKIMQDKLAKSSTSLTKIPGLLVWYGTGTGKTITASIVGKILGFCNSFRNIQYGLNIPSVQNIIITSPKSAFNNFKKELESIMKVFFNKLQTKVSGDEDNFYYNAKNANIYIFSHPKFNDIFMNSLKDPTSFFNETFLRNSLLIVDEVHNYSNTEVDEDAVLTSFMLKCCSLAKQVLLLTATPMRNSPKDMEVIMSFLNGKTTLNRQFEKEYAGIFGDPFIEGTRPVELLSPNHISDTTTFFNNIEFGDTKLSSVLKVLKKDDVIRNGKLNTNSRIRPTKTAREIEEYFKERIIYYIPEEQVVNPLPDYVEKIYFVFPSSNAQRIEFVNKFLVVQRLECRNDTIDCTNPFYSKENEYIWKNTTVKTDSILNIIATRETTHPDDEIIYNINPIYNFNNFGLLQSFKYIIFCNYEINVTKIKNTLITNGIDENLIGVIQGKTPGTKRKNIASDYDIGAIRIVIISKAGEEGVDFKRTGVIILADGVWTSSEYEQILGRAVRKNSNVPSTDDPNTKIPRLIECISIVFTCRTDPNLVTGERKYSGDLSGFNIVLKKKTIINKFKESIQAYFYNINQIVSGAGSWAMYNTCNSIEDNLKLTRYDGYRIQKKSKRRKNSKRRSKSKKVVKSRRKYRSRRRSKTRK